MRIYNTQTRHKEELIPLREGEYHIYACGPTVYDYFHIGNARPLVIFDVLRRYLEYRGNKVIFVQNFTDIDDKMIRRAQQEGTTVAELGERFIGEYQKDAKAMGIREATVHPRATDHIPEIIDLVQKLVDKGLAYATSDGVYFNTQTFDHYGHLSGQDMEALEAGARIDVDDQKRHPMDFAVWKAEKPGEPAWDSPWGRGRPGWHIECSAMSMKYLGETLDIHCGGQDLVFPHHENEVAQSEGATGKPFARYWMHNGYINIDNQKMSKSAGNFFTVREIGEQYDLMAVRFFLLSAQYRSPVNFAKSQMEQAEAALARLRTAYDNLVHRAAHAPEGEVDPKVTEAIVRLREDFDTAMDDDLNTADAIAALFEYVRVINGLLTDAGSKASAQAALEGLMEISEVLGLSYATQEVIPQEILDMAEARAAARKAKEWAESDRLRDEIAAKGYVVEDTREGQKVRKA